MDCQSGDASGYKGSERLEFQGQRAGRRENAVPTIGTTRGVAKCKEGCIQDLAAPHSNDDLAAIGDCIANLHAQQPLD